VILFLQSCSIKSKPSNRDTRSIISVSFFNVCHFLFSAFVSNKDVYYCSMFYCTTVLYCCTTISHIIVILMSAYKWLAPFVVDVK